MVQITGHFKNDKETPMGRLLHKLITDTYAKSKGEVKKHKMRLDNEGSEGKDFEGFDVYPSAEVAKEIWSLFGNLEQSNVKRPQELKESNDTMTEGWQGLLTKVSSGLSSIGRRISNFLKMDKSLYNLQMSGPEDIQKQRGTPYLIGTNLPLSSLSEKNATPVKSETTDVPYDD